MQKNTALVTLPAIGDQVPFDFDIFSLCKPYLAEKDRCIVDQTTQYLIGLIRKSGSRSIRLLDAGSGDGTVIQNICRRLLTSNSNSTQLFALEVDCIEPSHDGLENTKRLLAQLNDSRISVNAQVVTVEDYINNSSALKYDAIICCHLLYHIPIPQWPSLLARLKSMISSTGILIVNLVSSKSDIYRLKVRLEQESAFKNLYKDYDRFGFEYFAEDFESVIKKESQAWDRSTLSANIRFTSAELAEAHECLRQSETGSALLRFLAFIYRITENDLLQASDELLANLPPSNAAGLVFKMQDTMFVWPKHNLNHEIA